jgi:hypothetical protein
LTIFWSFSSLKQTLIILDHELLERLIRGDGKLREASKLCILQITFLHEPESNDPNLHNHLKSRALFLSRIDHVMT